MEDTKIDLYNYDKQFESGIARIKNSRFSKINKNDLMNFIDDCIANGLSRPRVIYYMNRILVLLRLLKKDFRKAMKQDIKELVKKINENEKYTENTKRDYKITIKKYYKWLKGIDEKGFYPEEVRWISTTLKNNNHLLPEELLTEEEISMLIETAEHPRDKALIATLADSGCRIGEILTLRLKHLTFDEHGAILVVGGKTGMRRIRVIGATPYLASWKNMHPEKDNPEAPLWVVRGTTKDIARSKEKKKYKLNWHYALSYRAATKMINNVAEKAHVKKRVNPHSFRHARATFLAKHLTDAQLKELFGWAQSSKMAATYIHMSGRDTEKALLRVYGKEKAEKEEDSKLKPRRCPRCQRENGAGAKFCDVCGMPLDIKIVIELEDKRKDKEKEFADSLDKELMAKLISTMKKYKGETWLKKFLAIP